MPSYRTNTSLDVIALFNISNSGLPLRLSKYLPV